VPIPYCTVYILYVYCIWLGFFSFFPSLAVCWTCLVRAFVDAPFLLLRPLQAVFCYMIANNIMTITQGTRESPPGDYQALLLSTPPLPP